MLPRRKIVLDWLLEKVEEIKKEGQQQRTPNIMATSQKGMQQSQDEVDEVKKHGLQSIVVKIWDDSIILTIGKEGYAETVEETFKDGIGLPFCCDALLTKLKEAFKLEVTETCRKRELVVKEKTGKLVL